jgi:hypothetical protein
LVTDRAGQRKSRHHDDQIELDDKISVEARTSRIDLLGRPPMEWSRFGHQTDHELDC